MMVPDYALIGEIMFFAYGFAQARECGAKMVTTFKLCSEQLSAQVIVSLCRTRIAVHHNVSNAAQQAGEGVTNIALQA